MENIIGFIAAVLTTISTLPQFIETVKTKNVDGVSLGMFVTLNTGVCLWFIYGLLKQDTPLIIANFITMIFITSNIIMILKYRKPAEILNKNK